MKDLRLYCYSRPNTMIGHKYTDDVAICYAVDINEAMKKFEKYYSRELLKDHVEEVKFIKECEYEKYGEVAILTDY